MNYRIHITLLVLGMAFVSGPVLADEPKRDAIPGEEVKTETGKTVKVWSTKGPVAVSKAPEPFEYPSEKSIEGVPVIVDYDGNGNRPRHPNRRPEPRGPRN